MERFKNYALWLAVFSFIPIFLKGFNIDILPQNYNEIVNSLLGVLVLAGILNNPSLNKGFSDKTEDK